MKIIRKVFVPRGWEKREGFLGEWFLKSDRGSGQPLGTHISKFDRRIDYSGKTGFQCTLGEFAGRFCYVSPMRETEAEAVTDCYKFMKNYKDKDGLKGILDACHRVTPDNQTILIE